MCKKWSFVLFSFFLFTLVVKAQNAYIGPQLGWQKAADADNSKFMIGGAFRIKLSPSFGMEGSINYRQEKYNNGAVTVTSWPVMITGLLYPINIIYGAIGVGWYNSSFEYAPTILSLGSSRTETEQKFGWHFGAGVEIPLSGSENSPNSILTADLRYVFLNYDFQKMPGSPGLKSDFVVFTVGLLFNL